MTTGKTHSGKTTFGKKLAKKIKNNVLIDTDQIAEFLKDSYPNLYSNDFLKNSTKLAPGYFLKKEVANTIFKNAFKTDYIIISTSANSTKKLRSSLITLAKKNNRKVIMVYFNLPEEILLNRIDKNNRSKKCLYYSKDFKDLLLNKQSTRFEGADKKESDYFFEINKITDVNNAYNEILNIIKK